MRRLFSSDHRIAGRQYFWLAFLAALIGVALSLLMRFHLMSPATPVSWFERLWPTGAPGGVMTPELYLSLMTIHGTIMVFFVLSVAPQNAFGHYMIPLQIGSRNMAYPYLSAISFWLTAAAFSLLLGTFFVAGGAPLSGWTAYPPLSAIGPVSGPGEGAGQSLWIVSIGLFCFASILGSINFIATILELRRPGLRLMDMPLTCWNWLMTAFLSLLGFPVLLAASVLLLLDRSAGSSFFVPGGLLVNDRAIAHEGGSPLLWQHLFWFFGHPEVYIAILPGMGVVSEVLSRYANKAVFGKRMMVLATFAIAFLGLLVWGHHMFTSGMSPYSSIAFSVLSMTIGVPSAIKTFNWIGTIWGGRIEFSTAMLFALGFVSVFITGGLSGIFLGQPVLDLYLHDTYFVVAHFHLIMGVAAVFGIFAATFYWFPRMFGRALNETLGRIHFVATFTGVYALFVPMHLAGIAGNPRRYADFTNFEFLSSLVPLHRFMTWAAFLVGAAQLIFVANLLWTLFRSVGRKEMEESSIPAAVRKSGGAGLVAVCSAILMFFGALISAFIIRGGITGAGWRPVDVPPVLYAALFCAMAASILLEIARRTRKPLLAYGVAVPVLSFVLLHAAGVRELILRAGSFSNTLLAFFVVFSASAGVLLGLSAPAILPLAWNPGRRPETFRAACYYWHYLTGMWAVILLFLRSQ